MDDGQDFWAVQAGIEKKFIEYGKTTIYGEYYDYDGGATSRVVRSSDALNPFGADAAVWETGCRVSAAASLKASTRRRSFFTSNTATTRAISRCARSTPASRPARLPTPPFTDLDIVFSGGIIRF